MDRKAVYRIEAARISYQVVADSFSDLRMTLEGIRNRVRAADGPEGIQSRVAAYRLRIPLLDSGQSDPWPQAWRASV